MSRSEKDPDTYFLQVRFQRSHSADSDVLSAQGIEASLFRLTEQFCRELQIAYDDGGMDGLFTVEKVFLGDKEFNIQETDGGKYAQK